MVKKKIKGLLIFLIVLMIVLIAGVGVKSFVLGGKELSSDMYQYNTKVGVKYYLNGGIEALLGSHKTNKFASYLTRDRIVNAEEAATIGSDVARRDGEYLYTADDKLTVYSISEGKYNKLSELNLDYKVELFCYKNFLIARSVSGGKIMLIDISDKYLIKVVKEIDLQYHISEVTLNGKYLNVLLHVGEGDTEDCINDMDIQDIVVDTLKEGYIGTKIAILDIEDNLNTNNEKVFFAPCSYTHMTKEYLYMLLSGNSTRIARVSLANGSVGEVKSISFEDELFCGNMIGNEMYEQDYEISDEYNGSFRILLKNDKYTLLVFDNEFNLELREEFTNLYVSSICSTRFDEDGLSVITVKDNDSELGNILLSQDVTIHKLDFSDIKNPTVTTEKIGNAMDKIFMYDGKGYLPIGRIKNIRNIYIDNKASVVGFVTAGYSEYSVSSVFDVDYCLYSVNNSEYTEMMNTTLIKKEQVEADKIYVDELNVRSFVYGNYLYLSVENQGLKVFEIKNE